MDAPHMYNLPVCALAYLAATQFDNDYGYEVFLKKAMAAKDEEERKRNEAQRKANK